MEEQNYFEFCKTAYDEIKERLKLKDSAGFHYLAQISTDTENNVPTYAFQLTGMGELLAPVTFMNAEESKIRAAIEQFVTDIDVDFVEEAFHLAQAERAEKALEFHKEQAKNIKNRVAIEGKTTIGKIRKGYKGDKNAKNH